MTTTSHTTRRRTVALLLTCLALLAAACGSDDGGSTTAAGTDLASTEERGAFPVTVEHKFGSTEIDEEPERIIALGYTDLDYVLALGHVPVAARYPQFGDESTPVRSWAEDEAGSTVPEVLSFPYGELGFEAIASLQPDLILAVTSGITEEEYATLSAIAPTVAQTDEFVDFGMPWQDITTLVGEALGREDRAEALVAEVEDLFAEARAAHPEFEGTSLASAYYGAGEVLFFASEDLRARFFTSLGFEVPAELDQIADGAFYGSISLEQLELIDTDVLVWSQLSFTDGGREAIESDPLVHQLDAVREGRALYVGGEVDDAYQVSSILSLPAALEGMVPMLDRALDGDPATTP